MSKICFCCTGNKMSKEGIDRPYENAFWYLVDSKSSDIYTIQVMLFSHDYFDVDYRACSLQTRLENKDY